MSYPPFLSCGLQITRVTARTPRRAGKTESRSVRPSPVIHLPSFQLTINTETTSSSTSVSFSSFTLAPSLLSSFPVIVGFFSKDLCNGREGLNKGAGGRWGVARGRGFVCC